MSVSVTMANHRDVSPWHTQTLLYCISYLSSDNQGQNMPTTCKSPKYEISWKFIWWNVCFSLQTNRWINRLGEKGQYWPGKLSLFSIAFGTYVQRNNQCYAISYRNIQNGWNNPQYQALNCTRLEIVQNYWHFCVSWANKIHGIDLYSLQIS